MIIKIYIDVLIISTFIIITIINYIVEKVLKQKVNRLIVLFVNFLVSLIMSLIYLKYDNFRLIVGILLILLNVLSIYKYTDFKNYLKQVIYTILATMIVQMSLYTLINLRNKYTLIILLLSFALTFVILNIIKSRLSEVLKEKNIYDVVLSYKKETISLKALKDTGNSSNFISKPLSFLRYDMLNEQIKKEVSSDNLENFVLSQEIKSINGFEKVNIIIFDYLKIFKTGNQYQTKEYLYIKSPAIGIIKGKLSHNGEFDMILNPRLFL